MEALRVTPAQMQAARRDAFVLRSKSNPSIWLWCLRVRAASGIARRSRRLRLFVGLNAEILTGRRRGQQQRAREILSQGFVPIFFLLRQVSLRKRLDVAGVRRRAPGHPGARARRRAGAPRMSGSARTIAIRLTADNAEPTRRALEQVGESGERALRGIDAASAAAQPALQGLATASDGAVRP